MVMERYRIMVVDDDPDLRELLQVTLSDRYEVFEATNGLDAMLKLTKYQPDLAIVDVMMPLMNGLELARKIRETPGYQDLPIIALSALNSKEDIKSGYGAGANLYLTKPFQPERVTKNIEMTLQERPVRNKDIAIAEIRERERRHQEQLKRALEKKKDDTRPEAVPARPTLPPPTVIHPRIAPPRTATPEPTPMPEQMMDALTPMPSGASASAARPRVLVVDDDEDYLMIQRSLLEESYEVLTASDGYDAMDKIPDAEPDIYVIDAMMPKMSGYQLLDMLRSAMETRDKPVVFASAKGSPRDRKTVETKGVVHYLVKPFPEDALLRAIRDVVASPGFRVQPKKLTIRELLFRDGKRRAEAVQTTDKKKMWETYGTLEKFLKKTGREATSREE